MSVPLKASFVILLVLLVNSCCGHDKVGNRKVTYMSAPQNWFKAMEICQSKGMQLLTVDCPSEQEDVKALAEKYNAKPGLWLSGNDLASEGSFVWGFTREPVTFSRWNIFQPNNLLFIEHCIAVIADFEKWSHWDDVDCRKTFPFFCQEAEYSREQLRKICNSPASNEEGNWNSISQYSRSNLD